jgi:hypothetical protein
MGLHDVLHDRQSQTRSAEFPRPGPIDPIKPLKDPGEVFFRNADPAVLNFNFNEAPFFNRFDLDGSFLRSVFDGVLKKIDKNLIDFFRVRPERYFGRDRKGKDLLFFLCERGEQQEIFLDARLKGDCLGTDRIQARLDPGKVQQILNDILQPVAVFLQDRQKFLGLRRVLHPSIGQRLEIAFNGGQRGPKFVRDIGDEIFSNPLLPFYFGDVVKDQHHRAILGTLRDGSLDLKMLRQVGV